MYGKCVDRLLKQLFELAYEVLIFSNMPAVSAQIRIQKNRQEGGGGGVLATSFSYKRMSQRALRTSLENPKYQYFKGNL